MATSVETEGNEGGGSGEGKKVPLTGEPKRSRRSQYEKITVLKSQGGEEAT